MLALLLVACWVSDPEIGAKFLDTDEPTLDLPTEKTGDADADADADADSDADADVDRDCPDGDLGSGVGEGVAQGSTAGAGDDLTPVCYGATGQGGPDRAYTWTPPSDGCWELDTLGAGFDTVLYVRDGCDGRELGCNDDLDYLYGVSTSDLGIALDGGHEVVIVVDGYDQTASGPFALDIVGSTELPADLSLGSVVSPSAADGDSKGADTTLDPNLCPYSSGADLLLEWTAPDSGIYYFDLTGSDYDTVLSLHRPCTREPIACVDAFGDGGEVLDAWLVGGETVILRIAGWNEETGHWELSVTKD